jgi:peptidoglycan/xylan/chitin deacetylase (PgdA/CDA1 family)
VRPKCSEVAAGAHEFRHQRPKLDVGEHLPAQPESRIEQVAMMESILISRATGGSPDGHAYEYLRREVLADVELRALVPES